MVNFGVDSKGSDYLPAGWLVLKYWLGVFLCWVLLAWSVGVRADSSFPVDRHDLYRDAMLAITEGRLGDAKLFLADLVAEEPRHAGAWLDLAILYCAAGDAEAAEALFREIEQRFSPPVPILEVIARQRKLGCEGKKPKNKATFRLGRGFESNVNQGARNPNISIGSGGGQIDLVLLPEYLPHSDQFTNISGELQREISENGAFAMAQFQSRNYDQLSRYNTTSLFVGFELPWRLVQWGGRVAGTTGFMTLDGEIYFKQSQLQVEVEPFLSLPSGWHVGVTGSWSYINYPTLQGFDADWLEIRGALSYRGADSWWQGGVGAIQDRQLGQRPGGDRTGSFVSVQGRTLFGRHVMGELGWQLQRWEGGEIYFPGIIDSRREQLTRTFRAAVIFPLNDAHAIHVELRDVRNQENIPIFDYRSNMLQLSWQWHPLN